MTFFSNNETISTLERQAQRMQESTQKRKRHIMEKTTLKRIIRAVRELEVKKSKNDSQFEFYQKKKRRIEKKERRMAEETNCTAEEIIKHYKQNKETLDFCYGFMDKIENENKIINNQIEQYLTNYIVIVLIENNLKNLKMQITKLLNEYNQERTKLTINTENYQCMFIR